ncbi:MAG: exodeoxyribonuclease III [Acidimicrobiales bacterium]|jgi:exodeoxyribonuclease III
MRIATWNVNSMRARIDRVGEWLETLQPDVCCFQETKLADDAFPSARFSALGYEVAHHGDGRWNGVAIVSRVGLEDVARGFAASAEPLEGAESRLISATCGGVRVMSVYVPNGRAVDSEHFSAKLAFLHDLRLHLDVTCDPASPAVLCGDFNVAPGDIDVFDPAFFVGATHVTTQERAALAEVLDFGLTDVFRESYPDTARLFTWWDYRAGDFHSGRGMRIDLVLATRVLAERVRFVLVDRNARKGKQPSDHAPVIVELDYEAPGAGT